MKGFLNKIKRVLFLGVCLNLTHAKAQIQITQCAIDMVKGLDSLVNFPPVTSCGLGIINEHRTILNSSCAMTFCSYATSTRFVFNTIQVTDPSEFYLHWPVATTPITEFTYWGICYPPATPNNGYFGNANPCSSGCPCNSCPSNDLFPNCGLSAQNFSDRIKIKKIVYTPVATLQDESTHKIVSLKNPRLMTPADPFWSFVTSTNFNNVYNASGILVDVTLNDDTRYTGMLWHHYSPEGGAGGNLYMNWKYNIFCAANISALNVTGPSASPGPCSQFQFDITVSGAGAVTSCPDPGASNLVFDHGDGSTPVTINCVADGVHSDVYTYVSPGTYTPAITIYGPGSCVKTLTTLVTVSCPPPCVDCIPSFAPIPGKKYVISAWVKDKNAPQSTTSYTDPRINITFVPSGSVGPFTAKGNIIDGWQRIEEEFTVPALATDLNISLECLGNNCYFDDIRVFPVDGSMKSYVYDPVNLRLVAELDERHYSTMYEYNEEGKLVRVKKETEKGKMTIQENRNNTKK